MPKTSVKSLITLVIFSIQIVMRVSAGSQFASHVTINTPVLSFSHGVGDPLPFERKSYQRKPLQSFPRSLRQPSSFASQSHGGGYPRTKPSIPFNNEDVYHDNSLNVDPWQYIKYVDEPIAILPPSPYRVDSPDPESLWPEGLFIPPTRPHGFGNTYGRRADNGEVLSESDPMDPYLLEGTEAIAAIEKVNDHGFYFFHDVPHIQSLFANQEKRIKNKLTPHRIASIRHTWPYNRP